MVVGMATEVGAGEDIPKIECLDVVVVRAFLCVSVKAISV